MRLNFTGIIPARYDSSRFPGKPLALVNGVPMLIRVWQKAREALDEVYIATDNQEIFDTAVNAGAKAIMTSGSHQSGTDRIAEAAEKIFGENKDMNNIVLNIQGDEPLITKEAISGLCNAFKNEEVGIATLVHKITDPADIDNPNRPKVVFNSNNKALYFSRSPIPYVPRDSESSIFSDFFKHIGVYAFRLPVLLEISKLKPSGLEQKENLEQLRWLENSYNIHCVQSTYSGIGIDTPEDLEKVNKLLGEELGS